jgi:hypothetical protein
LGLDAANAKTSNATERKTPVTPRTICARETIKAATKITTAKIKIQGCSRCKIMRDSIAHKQQEYRFAVSLSSPTLLSEERREFYCFLEKRNLWFDNLFLDGQ